YRISDYEWVWFDWNITAQLPGQNVFAIAKPACHKSGSHSQSYNCECQCVEPPAFPKRRAHANRKRGRRALCAVKIPVQGYQLKRVCALVQIHAGYIAFCALLHRQDFPRQVTLLGVNPIQIARLAGHAGGSEMESHPVPSEWHIVRTCLG